MRSSAGSVHDGLAGGAGGSAALDRAIDHLGREDVLDHHDRGADRAGAVAELRAARSADHRVASGSERWKMTSRTPASSCWWATAMSPPMTIDARVEEVDAAGEHLAEAAAGVADGLDRLRLAGAHEARRRRGVVSPRAPRRVSLRGERAPAGDGLQAADVAAAADDVVVTGEPDVADVARRALRAAVDPAAGHDPAADAGADLHVEQVLACHASASSARPAP